MASIIVRFVSIVPLFALVLASIFCLTGCREKPKSAVNNDKVVQDSVVMPTDTVKVLTDDEKIDSVRATLKGYKIIGVTDDGETKHLFYYKGQTIFAYCTGQQGVVSADIYAKILDAAVNPKTNHVNVITEPEPDQHFSMKLLYDVFYVEAINDDDGKMFCSLNWEEVGSGHGIEFVNNKTKIKITNITGQTFDNEGNPDYLTEEEIVDIY